MLLNVKSGDLLNQRILIPPAMLEVCGSWSDGRAKRWVYLATCQLVVL